MAKNTKDVYGAQGTTSLLGFDPDVLVLVTDKKSPLYDERVHDQLDEAFVRNVDYHGVLQAISVWKNPETGKTEVIMGRQRVKAAQEVNRRRRDRGVPEDRLLQVPAIIYRGELSKILDALISENEARREDTPLGRAEKMRRLLAEGRGEDQVAVVFNCSVGTVRDMLALLDAPSAVRDAIQTGQIKVAHAKHLAKLPPEEQRTKVKELIEAGAGATGHAKARAQRAVVQPDKPRMKTRKEILAELEVDPTSERGKTLRWVLGIEEPIALPGLDEAKAAMRDFEVQMAA